jgi:hypothetical protein
MNLLETDKNVSQSYIILVECCLLEHYPVDEVTVCRQGLKMNPICSSFDSILTLIYMMGVGVALHRIGVKISTALKAATDQPREAGVKGCDSSFSRAACGILLSFLLVQRGVRRKNEKTIAISC